MLKAPRVMQTPTNRAQKTWAGIQAGICRPTPEGSKKCSVANTAMGMAMNAGPQSMNLSRPWACGGAFLNAMLTPRTKKKTAAK